MHSVQQSFKIYLRRPFIKQKEINKLHFQANVSEALCSGVYASDNTTDGGLVAQEVENTKSSGKYIIKVKEEKYKK